MSAISASANAVIGIVVGGCVAAAAALRAARIALQLLFAIVVLLPLALLRRRLFGDRALRLASSRAGKAGVTAWRG